MIEMYYQPYQQNYTQNYAPNYQNTRYNVVNVNNFEQVNSAVVNCDGSVNLFIDNVNGFIYTKQLAMNGMVDLKVYKLSNEPIKSNTEELTSIKESLSSLSTEVKELKQRIESVGVKNERNASYANAQSIKK